jgi:antitoxin (DNA-binding transcriptional repressor) of toxin-antitoxin stability system
VKRASITELKNGLSAAIDMVRHGDAIVIEDRGVPVARLEPVLAPGRSGSDGRTARLVRQGVLRPAATAPPRRVLAVAPPSAKGRASLSQALLDERRSGR